MRQKVSDYIADFLVKHSIRNVFTVVGGGAMHMNDSFGHNPDLTCIYNHHEQASAMAAEAYARVDGTLAALCVTSGPGAINALNGVAGAYMDSIPMLVFSGQTKSTMTVKSSGLKLRTLGNQEFDIVSTLSNVAKYYEMVEDASRIRYCLEKMYHLAVSGRPGPTWLDIPLDIQGAFVETDSLVGYSENEEPNNMETDKSLDDKTDIIINRLKEAKRPILYAGNGIRIGGAADKLHEFVKQSGIPVVTCWDSIDLMETDDELYVGRGGTMGDRAGNFAVQNSDLLLCIGTRLNIYQVGYNVKTWARGAYVIDVDIDSEELKKPTIRVDLPVCADAKNVLEILSKKVTSDTNNRFSDWQKQCKEWKEKYPVVSEKHWQAKDKTNVYAFIDTLSRSLADNDITVVANGSASVVGSQSYYIGKGQRFIMNCGMSSMGYDLPAAVGAAVASAKKIICIAGDGSIQMNIQELQTIVTNRLPVKIFVISNGGYHQIRLTQNNIFHNGLVGVGPESSDLGFPDFEKLAYAYRIPYGRIFTNEGLKEGISKALNSDGYYLCEIECDTEQVFEPKSATKRLEDGSLFSPPLEDLAPFLSREELAENMYIPMIEE